MSNQCSNLCDYRSFSFCTPFLTPLKPYTTTRRRFFPFQHNLILIGRRSRRRSSSLPLKAAAESSSGIVLVATKEHSDGSFVFRFGNASEVVENDDVEEEIESQIEQDSFGKVLDEYQDGQVIMKMADRGYDSVEGRLTEVADGIGNADIDSDIAESETNATRDLSDYHAASSDILSDISEKEALVSQSDANLNDSIKVAECTLDEAKFNVQLDEEESSDPTIYLLDNSPNIKKNAYPEGTLLKGSDDKPVDPSVSVELESKQVSHTKATSKSDTDNVSVELESSQVLQIEVMDELYKVETEDTRKNDAEEDGEDELKDMIVNEGTLIDELPPSNPLDIRLMDAVTEDAEEELQDANINEATIIDEMPSSDQLVVEQPQSVDDKDQTMEELQHVSTKNREEKDVAYVMSFSHIEESNLVVEDMNISDGTFTNKMATSGPLASEPTLAVSTTKGMDVKDVDMNERLQDTNISEDTFIDEMSTSDPLGAEPTLEISTTKGMDVKDVDRDEKLQDMNTSEGIFIDEMETSDLLGAKRTLEVSTTKDMDVKNVDMDERLQDMNTSEGTFIDKMPTCDPLGAEQTLEVSTTKGVDVKDVDTHERLQDMNISEGPSIDEMLTSDPLGAEPTLKVSTTEGLGVKDLAIEAELHLVSNDNMSENSNADVMPAEPIVKEEVSQPHSTPVELKPTMEISYIKVQDCAGQNLDDEILQVIGEDAGDGYIEDVEGVNHNMLEQCAETDALESSILLKQGAYDPLLEAERSEGVVGSSELADASEVTALLLSAEAEVEREEIYVTDDILLSGAAMFEHPFKALTGGDDAYFVAGSKWLGVASAVSQWSFEGTGPGVYAQEFMRTCEEIVLDTSRIPMTNPVELLCRGIKETNMSGSSNVLIANFNGQALHVANIGDTGFFIIRQGAVYKKSSPLLHEFHFALQVEDSDDPLQLVEEYLIELEVGDIVVSATDGLFDNLYEREITMIVSKSLQARMKPQEIANILAKRAQEVGKSSFVRSPFSDAAQAAGYTGYSGGKPDNVAVIVSLVEKRSNLLAV